MLKQTNQNEALKRDLLNGLTYRQIGDKRGCCAATVCKMVKSLMEADRAFAASIRARTFTASRTSTERNSRLLSSWKRPQ